jgi:hypothetical protein
MLAFATTGKRGNVELKDLMLLIDEAATVETERLALDRRSKELKKSEEDYKAKIMQAMNYLGLTTLNGYSGKTATMKHTVEPVVNDWSQTLQYIRETGNLDLLHKRLTASAVKLRWADGISIPGVDQYEETKLTIT